MVGWIKVTLPIITIVLLISSCQPEVERPASDDTISLAFSTDTIFFDTIFTQMRSVTKRFKVYNKANGEINLSKIELKDQESSPFSIFINGEKGHSFRNISLLGKDSLLVLIEAEIDHKDEDLPFVIEDKLVISTQSTVEIPVIAWGQDAVFLKDSILSCNMRFTADRPYLLYGTILVDSLCSLEVDAGARIYNHYNSTLYIRGSLHVNGNAQNLVIFSNDRFEEDYLNAPGQWRGIYFLEGSRDNNILYADISNAEVGLRVGMPDDDDDFDLTVGHTIIRNMSTFGILSYTSDVSAYNSLIQNCVVASVAAVAGGNYRFWNNTFANYSYDFFREDATLILSDNVVLSDNTLLVADLSVDLKNNIIWGSSDDELVISTSQQGAVSTFSISNNLIRTTSDTLSDRNIINTDPKFLDPATYHYKLDSSSVAIDAGITLPGINTDILGKERINLPDLGAYENQ